MGGPETALVQAPLAYESGYKAARAFDRRLADNYIRHTVIGDPELDPIMRELSDLNSDDLHRFVAAGIEGDDDIVREAPESLRKFFRKVSEPPWLDHDAFGPGIRAFHSNASLFLVAFVCGVLVEGFATLISKSFHMTERLAHTDRRLKQNNRQLFEIFLPDGYLLTPLLIPYGFGSDA